MCLLAGRPKAASFDSQHNTIKVGDTVTVTAGEHLKLSGTIKHMIKGMLWLHSDHYMKNSGIFVAKSKLQLLLHRIFYLPFLNISND